MAKRSAKYFLLFSLLFATWVVVNWHRGVFPPPVVAKVTRSLEEVAQWYPKSFFGVQNMVLQGEPYERGLAAGEKTKELLLAQEQALEQKLSELIPSALLRQLFFVGIIRWFWGIESYFETHHLEEMLGVAQNTSHQFDYLADRFTRQIGYHGLHEVGQMMVDSGMACTLVAHPSEQGWTLGRNFDFEGGAIFDREKIVKWVFPSQGNAFVSVIWAGMVGAVTGVNEKGLYLSINSAGTDGYRRYGTPSTLILVKALQEADTSEQAAKIIQDTPMMISDIFIVADASGNVLQVEKGPEKSAVLKRETAFAVANHMESEIWNGDSTNESRKTNQTTLYRKQRGEELVHQEVAFADRLESVLSWMRDKKAAGGQQLALGNRRALDALIASHGVIYDQPSASLYVSQGPALAGAFSGFNLKESFQQKRPVVAAKALLAAEAQSTRMAVDKVRELLTRVEKALKQAAFGDCNSAEEALHFVQSEWRWKPMHDRVLALAGDVADCRGNRESAKIWWAQALEAQPAYLHEVRALQERLKR